MEGLVSLGNTIACIAIEELIFARQFLMNIKSYNFKLLLIPKFWYPLMAL